MVNIVNDMVDLSRIESGDIQLKTEFCDIGVGLDLLQKQIKPVLAAKNQKLAVEKQVYHTTFFADRSVLQRITSSLLEYVSKVTPSREFIKIMVFELPSLQQGYVRYRLSLSAEQASVNEEEVKQRLEAFGWLDRSNGGQRLQSGLGLAIAKGLAAEYQGSLDVKYSGETGLEFVTDMQFRIADAEDKNKKTVPVSANKNLALQNLRILVAENKMISILVARKLLASKGVKADYVKSGKLVCQKFFSSEDGYYDLIITELHMPDTDGYAATQMIRSSGHPQAKTIPIIGMSGNLLEDNEGKCLASGMNAFIPKPIKGDKLLKVIFSVMGSL